MRMPSSVGRRGFSLVELFVVLSITGILAGLLLPSVQASREAVRRIDCLNRIRNQNLASANYYSARNRLVGCQVRSFGDDQEFVYAPTLVELGAFLELQTVHEAFDRSQSAYSEPNLSMLVDCPAVYECPSAYEREVFDRFSPKLKSNPIVGGSRTGADYRLSSGSGYMPGRHGATGGYLESQRNVPRLSRVTDGLSNSILFFESTTDGLTLPAEPNQIFAFSEAATHNARLNFGGEAAYVLGTSSGLSYLYAWSGLAMTNYHGYTNDRVRADTIDQVATAVNVTNDFNQPFSRHPGGLGVGILDGSVRFVSETISPRVWLHMIIVDDGQSVEQ